MDKRRKGTVLPKVALHPKQERQGRTGREARRQQMGLSAYGLGDGAVKVANGTFVSINILCCKGAFAF